MCKCVDEQMCKCANVQICKLFLDAPFLSVFVQCFHLHICTSTHLHIKNICTSKYLHIYMWLILIVMPGCRRSFFSPFNDLIFSTEAPSNLDAIPLRVSPLLTL